MATGNLLLGQASGAVGSLVFARHNGKQVTKARQELVRYSNTLAQAIQRICISTAGQAYRHMQEVCCSSFQGIPVGKATHDEFMKRNVRLLRQSIRQADAQNLTYSDIRYFTPVGNDTLLPNAYIVSSGSLPSIIFGISPNDPTHARMAGGGISYRHVIAFYGLKRGDILTFVFMQPDSSGIVRARSARVVLDPWSPISGKASLDVPFVAADNKVNCPNPDNSGEFTYLVNDSGDIVYSLVNSDVPLIAAGVFVSRRTAAGSWLHSDCQLNLYSGYAILDKFTLQQAIDVANGAPIAAISPDYLNNAGTERIPNDKYKFVQYIEFTGSQYIPTNIENVRDSEFVIIASLTRFNGVMQTFLGAISKNRNYKAVLAVAVLNNSFYSQLGEGQSYQYYQLADFSKHTFKVISTSSKVSCEIDNTYYTRDYIVCPYPEYKLALGARQLADGVDRFAYMKFYQLQVHQQDFNADFRPCYHNGELGIVDIVNDEFYPIIGEGAVVGPFI